MQSIEATEAGFIARRQSPPDLPGATKAALASLPTPAEYLADRLHCTGAAIARAMDEAAATGPEPCYHDRHHAAEATLAMAALCRAAAEEGLISPAEAMIGVTAMIGHDIHHDGSTTTGGVLEARSCAAVRHIAATAGIDGPVLTLLGDVILATDPARVAANVAQWDGQAAPRTGQQALRVLANEADIFGSLMPILGPVLSLALAEEWRSSGIPALMHVATASGRLAFLRAYPPLSRPAQAVGLEFARTRCLQAYAAAGPLLGAAATPEAGCGALDQLPPHAAAAAYARALAAISPST